MQKLQKNKQRVAIVMAGEAQYSLSLTIHGLCYFCTFAVEKIMRREDD
jgi:N-acyl-L-homoserine lactone synthetase